MNVPGTPNLNTRVLTSRGDSLLIDASGDCDASGNSLLWFDPGTRAEKVLVSGSNFEIAGIDSTDGATVAVSGTTGVRPFSNAGGLIRSLYSNLNSSR